MKKLSALFLAFIFVHAVHAQDSTVAIPSTYDSSVAIPSNTDTLPNTNMADTSKPVELKIITPPSTPAPDRDNTSSTAPAPKKMLPALGIPTGSRDHLL